VTVEDSTTDLAARQLAAYNRADLDAFCACYHPAVTVLDADGAVSISGIAMFRERYAGKFAAGGFGATVSERLVLERHCVDLEHCWWLDADGARQDASVLVRYTVADGLIAVVQFLRP
jgi:hypothetical protein